MPPTKPQPVDAPAPPPVTEPEVITLAQFADEQGIPLAQLRHMAAVQKLTMQSTATAKDFAALLDATTKARV